jgi:nucleoside 2-deoxyribosyltransferase
MSVPPKIYLAGPEVFLPEASAIGRRKKDLCTGFGFEGLFPFDNEVAAADADVDRLIYRAKMRMIQEADCGIFNLTPFRGPSADVGTAFELGVLTGQGKPCFAYTNEGDPLLARLVRDRWAVLDEVVGRWVDRCGMTVENFGNSDNLMLDQCLAEPGHPIVRRQAPPEGRFTDLDGFVACLELASEHFFGGRRTAADLPAPL